MAMLFITTLAFGLVVRAADPLPQDKKSADVAKKKDEGDKLTLEQIEAAQKEAALKQEQLKRRFDEVKQMLLRLAQRLDSSPKPEAKAKAKALRDALNATGTQTIDAKFITLASALKGSAAFSDLDRLCMLIKENNDLRTEIRSLIERLLKDRKDLDLLRKDGKDLAKGEEWQYEKLHRMMDDLLDSKAKLVQVNLSLVGNVKPDELTAMSARTDKADQVLDKSQKVVKEVLTEYRHILKELKFNHADAKMINRVEKEIVRPLEEIDVVEFPATRDKMSAFRKDLDKADASLADKVAAAKGSGAAAREQLKLLLGKLNEVLQKTGELTDINKIVAWVREIEDQEESQQLMMERIRKTLENRIFHDLLDPGKKPENKQP
jgi:hypothetical protein